MEEVLYKTEDGSIKIRKYINLLPNEAKTTELISLSIIDSKLLPTSTLDGKIEEVREYYELKQQVKKALYTLTPVEVDVIKMRFGIGKRKYTLEETGREFGMTRQGIAYIEAKALNGLRHPLRAKLLKDF